MLIGEHFRFSPEWYRAEKIAALVLEYYVLLRSVLRTKPFLRQCLVRCRHCGIFFLTHPGNGGRKDLGCPFGCQHAHRRRQSTMRSVAYYRTPEGKRKKCDQNQKRNRRKADRQPPAAAPTDVPPRERSSLRWNPRLLPYVRMVISVIEGRAVSRTEILHMLEKVLRQHSHARRRKIDHTVAWLHEHPP
jgi:hypothetical protein